MTGGPDAPSSRVWRIRGGSLSIGSAPLLMGVLNVTPDSFSDGGLHPSAAEAVGHGLEMIEAGADLLDVGGESTRPGARPIDSAEELDRVLPVVEGLVARTGVPISVDTTKLEVAREAVAAGAHVLNDVSALRFDPGLADLAAATGVGLVLMHMRGEPRTMQDDPRYDDLLGEIGTILREAAGRARAAGVDREAIVLDPGIGFGKTVRDSYRLLASLERLREMGYPLLIGHSRKTFLDPERTREPAERLPESLAAGILAALGGAAILRVHDVAPHRRALAVLAWWREAREEGAEKRDG
ncbi:MAG TPA: dihydropteroate synthase [Gemmatimonadota bacterium]|nr:dihydropteroate synthase [Gemmatimonadota bacterium]